MRALVWFHTVYCVVMISYSMFEGDVNPEEILFLSGLLPGEAPWGLLLPHWGTHSFTSGKVTLILRPSPAVSSSFDLCMLSVGGGRWWQWPVRLWWWGRWEERRPGWTLLHAHRRDLWTQRKWVLHYCIFYFYIYIQTDNSNMKETVKEL